MNQSDQSDIDEISAIKKSDAPIYIKNQSFSLAHQSKANLKQITENVKYFVIKIDTGYKGLGISFTPNGIISSIEPNSPADKAGLKKDQRIVEVDGINVRSMSNTEMAKLIKSKGNFVIGVIETESGRDLSLVPSRDQGLKEEPQKSPRLNNKEIYMSSSKVKDLSYESSSSSEFKSSNTSHNQSKQARQEKFNQTSNIQVTPSPKSRNLMSTYTLPKDAPAPRLCRVRAYEEQLGFTVSGSNSKSGIYEITGIAKSSPADKSGLQNGDLIIEVSGVSVENLTYKELISYIRKKKNEDDLQFLVADRDTIDSYKQKKTPIPSKLLVNNKVELNDVRVCHLIQRPDFEGYGFSIKPSEVGPHQISGVEVNSPAEKSGLRVDDLILKVNDQYVVGEHYLKTTALIKNECEKGFLKLEVIDPKSCPTDIKNTQLTPPPGYSTIKPSVLTASSSSIINKKSDSLQNLRDVSMEMIQQSSLEHKRAASVDTGSELNYSNSRNDLPKFKRCVVQLMPGFDGGYGFSLNAKLKPKYMIFDVDPESPAYAANLRPTDVIVEIEKTNIRRLKFDKVRKMLSESRKKGQVEILAISKEGYLYFKKKRKNFSSVKLLSKTKTDIYSTVEGIRKKSRPKLNDILFDPKPLDNEINETKNLPIPRLCYVKSNQENLDFSILDLGPVKGVFIINEIKSDSDAACSGLKKDDFIIEICGISTNNLVYSELMNLIEINKNNLYILVAERDMVKWHAKNKITISSKTLPKVQFIKTLSNDEIESEINKGKLIKNDKKINQNHEIESKDLGRLENSEFLNHKDKQQIISKELEKKIVNADNSFLSFNDESTKGDDIQDNLTSNDTLSEASYEENIKSLNEIFERQQNVMKILSQSITHPAIQSKLKKFRIVNQPSFFGYGISLLLEPIMPSMPDHLIVYPRIELESNSPSTKAGLKTDQRIVAVNDKIVNDKLLKYEDVAQEIENNYYDKDYSDIVVMTSELWNYFVEDPNRINQMITSNNDPNVPRKIQIKRTSPDEPFGFDFRTIRPEIRYIASNVKIDSPAYKAGLRNDDNILEVNGETIHGMLHEAVVEKIKSNSNQVDLLVVTNIKQYLKIVGKKKIEEIKETVYSTNDNKKYSKKQIENIINDLRNVRLCHMVLNPEFDGYGFSIKPSELGPHAISDVLRNSPALKSGLKEDDLILKINDQIVVGISYEDTIKIIKESLSKGLLKFEVIEPNKCPGVVQKIAITGE